MKCSNLLCANKAEFVNTKTKQYKCKTCRNKGLDRDAITWFELREGFNDDEPLGIPKPIVKNKYSVVKNKNSESWSVYCDDEGTFLSLFSSAEEAQKSCDSLNKAYRKGVADVLSDLQSFSIDVRRKNGISWGGSSFNPTSNV
jgi:hypothetical protein